MIFGLIKQRAKSMLPDAFYDLTRRRFKAIAQWHTLRKLKYFGFRRYCPICKSRVRDFVAHKNDPERRYDSICPVCGCKSPHRRNWLFLEQYCRSSLISLRVLHVAPEPHICRRLIALPNVSYLSGDIREGVGLLKFDIRDLPFENESFDLIYCCHVLMMLSDDRQAIREMFRVLKRGGVALIENPVSEGQPTIEPGTPEDRMELFGHSDVMRLYGTDYRYRLELAGFSVKDKMFLDSISLGDQERMELFGSRIILSLKP